MNLHAIEREGINVFDIISANTHAFEKRFLDGTQHYNQTNSPYDKEIKCTVFHEYPHTLMNAEQYIITYDEFYYWVKNKVLIEFLEND